MIYRKGIETVERERWRWVAQYVDGTELRQFDDDTQEFHASAEVDQKRLVLFKMVCDGLPEVRIFWDKGMRLIHHYINTILEAGTPREVRFRQYVVGFEKDTPNGTRAWLAIISPDDSVTISDKE